MEKILDNFRLPGPVVSLKPVKSGHIHATWLVECQNEKFILQRINHFVFKDVAGLMENIVRLCEHLEIKIKNNLPEWVPMIVILTKNGHSYMEYDNSYWRIFSYVPHHPICEGSSDLSAVYEAGSAYGKFIHMLSDLPGKPLHATIPRFHDMDHRHNNLQNAIKNGDQTRVKKAAAEIDMALNGVSYAESLQKLIRDKSLPLRITHNDTKLSNILFNEHGKAICVIDLDTVMPGYIHYDFGDSMRSFANTAAEDEKDTNKILFNYSAFESYTKGFIKEISSIITKPELETLVLSPFFITCEQSVRFLTDYLENDKYYHISYSDHNLVRTRAQLTLMNRMKEAQDKMEEIILNCYN